MHIIVEDEEAATKAIDFFKRNRAGRDLPSADNDQGAISGQEPRCYRWPASLGWQMSCEFDKRLEATKNLLATTAIFIGEHARSCPTSSLMVPQ